MSHLAGLSYLMGIHLRKRHRMIRQQNQNRLQETTAIQQLITLLARSVAGLLKSRTEEEAFLNRKITKNTTPTTKKDQTN